MNDVQIIKSIMADDYYIVFKGNKRKGTIMRSKGGYLLTLFYKVNFTKRFATLTDAIQYAKEML